MKKVLIIAGEVSGDMHGANLVTALKKKTNDIEFFGLGGKRMEDAGVRLYYNLVDIAVLGLFEVLKNYATFRKIFDDTVRRLDEEKFDCVILIDYPGFNLQFAKYVKKKGIPLLYYISPQVWAWGKGRIKTIKTLIDKIVVLFKFEEELYSEKGLNVEFVGHPLLDLVKPAITKEESYGAFGLKKDKKTVVFFPGSREFEVRGLLPIMIKTAELIKRDYPAVQFLMVRLPSLKKDIFDNILKDTKLEIKLIEGRSYDAIEASDLMIIKSGTGTLEATILQKPMIITYKASFITYLITRFLIKLPYIGLVNVIAGKKIVPEFLQYNARANLIAKEAISILEDSSKANEIKKQLRAIKEKLGEPGANERAAEAVLKFLGCCG